MSSRNVQRKTGNSTHGLPKFTDTWTSEDFRILGRDIQGDERSEVDRLLREPIDSKQED